MDCCVKSPRSCFRRSMRPRFAETRNRLACRCIEAIKKIHDPGKDAAMPAVDPVGHSPRGLVGANAGVELPLQCSRSCIQSNDFLRRRVRVERPPDDQRIVLDAARLAGVERPCDLQLLHVGSIDLRKPGVVIAIKAAVVDSPALRSLSGTNSAQHGRRYDRGKDANHSLHAAPSLLCGLFILRCT